MNCLSNNGATNWKTNLFFVRSRVVNFSNVLKLFASKSSCNNMNDLNSSHSKILNFADCRQIPLWKINFTSENVSRVLELQLPRIYHIWSAYNIHAWITN